MQDNFFGNIYQSLNRCQEQELICWPSGTWTVSYSGNDIKAKVTLIRQYLEEEDMQQGQPILIALSVSFDLICTVLAVMAAGAIPVLPPAGTTSTGLAKLLHSKGIKMAVMSAALPLPVHLLAKAAGVRLLPLSQLAGRKPGEWHPPVPVAPEQAALITHSSGSTGKSKSIIRSHRVLQAQHQVLTGAFPPWQGQRDFPLFPNILLHNLSLGTKSILPDLSWGNLLELEPRKLVRQIVEKKIETMTGNLYYFRRLYAFLKQEGLQLQQVKAIGIGGSPVTEKLAFQLKEVFPLATIHIIYGSSEAEPIAIREIGAEKECPQKGYVVGKVHPSLKLQIDPIGEIVLQDGTTQEVGEIKVKGAHVAVPESEEFLSTGDYGYLDQQQQLNLTGRKGNEKLYKGVQHYQVEHVLQHEERIERVAAKVTTRGFDVYLEGTAAEADIRKALAQHFPAQLVQQIHRRKSLPVDARHHSKILYSNLV